MLNVCVYPLSQPSSRDVLYVKCCVYPLLKFVLNVFVYPLSQPSSRDVLYVKCLCTRYLSPAVEMCYMLNVCVYPLSQPQ